MSSLRRASFSLNNEHGVVPRRRSPRRLRTKTPSINELSKKFKVSPKGKRRLQFKPQEPLKGKKFYLDLQSFRKSGSLINRIKDLGGEVEEFLSKDISYVITNRKDVDIQCSAQSPSTPSPGLSVPSPIPGTKSSSMKGPSPQSVDSPNSTEPKHDTRGKALMKKATGMQKSGSCDVITNARTWGVQLIQLDKFLEKLARYVGKEKLGSKQAANDREIKASAKPKVRQLNAPFIKVEDRSRQFRPLVHELKEWPQLYFDTPVGTCPFDPPRRGPQSSQVRQKSRKEKGREEKQQKRGYCECCCCHYKDLDLHLRSDHHQTFARDNSNYVNLDALISKGPSMKDFLEKVRAKHREKSQALENGREEVVEMSSRQKKPKTGNSKEESDELANQTTPVKTPQGSETDSDASPTRITRSRSKTQKSDGTSPGSGQATKGRQDQLECAPLEEKDRSSNLAASLEDSQERKGKDTHKEKAEKDEERLTVRVTRSAKIRSASVSPQQPEQSVRSRQTPVSDDARKLKQSSKKDKDPARGIEKRNEKSPGSKGGGCTALAATFGDHDEANVEREPSPVRAVRVTRSNRSCSSAEEKISPSECDSGNGSAALNRDSISEEGHGEQLSAVTAKEHNPSSEGVTGEPTSQSKAQDFESFTKITRAKAKALSQPICEGLSNSAKNGSNGSCASPPPQDQATKQQGNSPLAATVVQKTRSSPRLTVFPAEETKESEGDDDSDKTESIQLSQEPSTPVRTQSMQVRLRNTLSGTSSSTITIISSCGETARTAESEGHEDESNEEPRAYPLRNRSTLPVKEQATNEKKTKCPPKTRGTATREIKEKEEGTFRQEKTSDSTAGVKLRRKIVSGASACCVSRNATYSRVESSPDNKKALSSASSSRSDNCSDSEPPSPYSSSPRSGPTPVREATAGKNRLTAKRAILNERSEETSSDGDINIKKQGKAKRKRRTALILEDESCSDSIDDSLIAHKGTPPLRLCPLTSPEKAGSITPGELAPLLVATESKGDQSKENKKSNIEEPLPSGACKLPPGAGCDILCNIFEAEDEKEEFHGFEVPHFDQSMSSERDLSFQIESIVENMVEKEAVPTDPSPPTSSMHPKHDEGKTSRTLSHGDGKRSRNSSQGNVALEPGCSKTDIGVPTERKVPKFEPTQGTRKRLNRDILDDVVTLNRNYLDEEKDETDSSSTVGQSADEEDKPAKGLTPRFELKFRRRKRVAETEHDNFEIRRPPKRSRSHSETSEECLPIGETKSTKSKKASKIRHTSFIAQEPLPSQEHGQVQETGNERGDGKTMMQDHCSGKPHGCQTILQDVFSGKQSELNMLEEVVYMTLEERVKLRRSRGKNREEPCALQPSSRSNSWKIVHSQKDTRGPEQEKKSRDGKGDRKAKEKRQRARELEQNAKERKRPEHGRPDGRKGPKRKTEKTKQIVLNRQPASTAEVLSERKRPASAGAVFEVQDNTETKSKRSASLGDDVLRNEEVAVRTSRLLKSRSGLTAQQTPNQSRTLKPVKPSKHCNAMSTISPSPSDRSRSSNSSCGTPPSSRLRISARRIFKRAATPGNRKKPRVSSTPVAGHLLTSRRKSPRFLIEGDEYEFMDENADVYEFCG